MSNFFKLFYLFFLTLLCSVIVGICTLQAQENTDSLQAETKPDSLLTGIKFYNSSPASKVSTLQGIRKSKLYGPNPSFENTTVSWDTLSTFRIKKTVYGREFYFPTVVDFDEYSELRKQQQKQSIQSLLVEESKSQESTGRGLLDFKISVPGGENSAFTTIFGTNEVNLRVNGSANMNVGASIQKLDDGSLPEDLRTQIDPTFNQNLQLNIQGTIGDKLTIATDWDTERQFDFENRLSIVYEGYEDEIIKSIEMGNVSMETGNSLVSGGKSLFGIKAVSELGPLRVTSVVSQQKGKNNSQKITGGSQETQINITPADYEDGRHFFLDFYNRNVYEDKLADPTKNEYAYEVSELYVYIRKADLTPGDKTVQAIALLDFGVNTAGGLPGNQYDRFNDEERLDSLRQTSSGATNSDFDAASQDYVADTFELLTEGIDYTFNRSLGYISMKSYINSGDAIAVSFVYVDPATKTPVQVGELSTTEGNRMYLKLLRPGGMTTQDNAWPLTMRNIYALGISGFTSDNLELQISDTRGNQPVFTLPDRSNDLLEDLGLDRVDSEGALGADNIIDASTGVLDASSGKLIFPYLEPFGSRIVRLLEEENIPDSVISEYAFTELYERKQSDARDDSKNRDYTITGVSSGGVSGSFTLGFGLVEGSVKVFANNVELTEGTDYEVDYSFGSLTILNDRYLASGQEIEVEYENNQFSIIGQKNFTGVRAEYTVNEDIKFGSTFFRLKEQPLSDKIRIGNEPINNTVLGLDGSAQFDTPWLTRFIDRIPLLQTKTPSSFSFTGEFAQIRPGVAQTNAVQEAIDNNELFEDEENGLVFIDDFEGAEYSISFLNPTRWNLAAAPAAVPGYANDMSYFEDPNINPPEEKINRYERSDLRSQFSWYSIPRNIESIRNAIVTEESRPIFVDEVFKGRQVLNQSESRITPLDIYYNPNQRGPYNYNLDLKNLLENEPGRTWGGMTAVIPPGQEDLVQNNIEFLEFWVQPVLPGGQSPLGQEPFYEGKIYIDLGIISDDVVPNGQLNTEDGLSTELSNLNEDEPTGTPRSYVPPSPPVPLGQFSNSNRQLEDVGLDGAPNPGTEGADGKDEGALFADFIQTIRDTYGEGSEMLEQVEADPSNDDYVYYGESKVRELNLNERFHRMLGYYDGNTPLSSSNSDKTAITLKPDSEGLVSSSSIQQSNSYYQYEIDFNPADRENLQIGAEGTYIVDRVEVGHSETNTEERAYWYLVRIPLSDFTRKIGEIDNFQNISYMRLWMSGYERPFTLRFATYEFIGSQWKKVTELTESPVNQDNFKVSTINIEENASREPFPYRQPDGSIRALNRGAQVQALENEQSLVLNVENLGPQEIHMVKRVYPGKLNLLNYSNVRMFVHGEGYNNAEDAELVVRFGSDLENNFYEYRQPVTPSEPRDFNYDISKQDNLEEEAQEIWRYEQNSMNIIISAFNILKQARDDVGADEAELFEDYTVLQNLGGDDVVEGAVLAIKGNPSLDRVSEIGLGIRNPFEATGGSQGTANLNAEFWLNELRVSGFDNEFGWAANAKSSVKLADFATVNANLTRRTNGFGGLDSRLGQRSVNDQIGYGLSTTINLHKLVPDRFGWSFPVSISTRKNTQTPKYLPDQGDIRLSDFKDGTNSNPDLTNSEKQDIINNKINDIQTVSENFSFNMSNISKTGSKSKLAQYTIDNLRLSYVYNKGFNKDPQLFFRNKWDYKASVQYNLRLRRVKLFRPFGFTENIPIAKVLSGLRVGYLPSSISTSTTFTRRYSEDRRKTLTAEGNLQALNQQHAFTNQNTFSLNYSLTPSIPITFNTSTSFDLSSAGIRDRNITGVDSASFKAVPSFEVLKGVVTDTLTARRSTYSERFTASWRPDLTKINGLNWLTYSASYGGGYQWNNSPRGSNLGASVANSFQLDNSLRLNTDRIFNKIGFFTKIKDADQKETSDRKSERDARKREAENTPDSLRTPRPEPELLKDLQYLGRKVFLAVFSMKDISTSYKRSKSGSQPGYSGASQFYYAFNNPGSENYSPPIGYRIGLSERIPREQLIGNVSGASEIRFPANNRYSDQITASTRITPLNNITVDLDWNLSVSSNKTENIIAGIDGTYSSTTTESGNYNTSVWAFGEGYEDLLRRQLETAYSDVVEGSNVLEDSLGNRDGRSVLNRSTLQDDFRRAYLGNESNGIGSKGFMAFPFPQWRINWTQFQRFIPFLGKRMSSATLSHSYRGSYRVDWSLNTLTGKQPGKSLGDFSIVDNRGLYEPTTIRVEQRFSPLVKLNVTWQSNLRTELGYDRGNISTFAINSNRVTETLTRGIDFGVNYTFRNVRISFLPRIKNNIDMSIRGSYNSDTDNTLKLDRDLRNALDQIDALPTIDQAIKDSREGRQVTERKRINGSFTLGYQISRTISSNFEYTFSRIESNNLNTRTNHDIRFNIRIAIRSR